MKKSELQDIADKLLDEYSKDRHYEITSAEKAGDGWRLEIREVTEPTAAPTENNEGAKNADNK